MSFVPPVYTVAPTFKPAGSDMVATPEQMGKNFDRYNEDQKAMAFQQHLQKGLTGMQEVMQQLPPEVQANVGDPSAFADSEDKRVAWYQMVNQAINRGNMAKASSNGDVAATEQFGLNDKTATLKDFNTASENNALDKYAQNFNPTKQTTKMVYQSGGLKNALADQESGGKYDAIGPSYKKADGSMADPNKGEVALGKYQILPATWFPKIGLDPTNKEDQQKFLATPELQDKAFDTVLTDSLSKYNGDMDKVIASYYGGPRAAALVGTPAADKPQNSGMPSINEYVKSVKAKLGANPESKSEIVTQDENKTQGDVALDVLKNNPRLIDKVDPLLKFLPKDDSGLGALKLAFQQQVEDDKNKRFKASQDTKVSQFEDKSSQDLYKKMQDAEVPVIGSTLKDLDQAMQKVGGLGSANAVPGTDLWNKSVYPWLKSNDGANLGGLLQRLYSLELKRISGVAVSDAEFNRYKSAFESGKTFSPEQQMYALRTFVRAFRTQVKTAKAAYGDTVWNRVAGPAGLDLPDLPDVPDAVGNPPNSTGAKNPSPGMDKKTSALRSKYGY